MTKPGGMGGSEGGLAKDHTFSDFFLNPSLSTYNEGFAYVKLLIVLTGIKIVMSLEIVFIKGKNPYVFFTPFVPKSYIFIAHSAPYLVVFWNYSFLFVVLFSSRDVEWGYFLAICQIKLSNSETLHIVKLHDFWSFCRVCLISHSGLLRQNKPDSIPDGILPTFYEIQTGTNWKNAIWERCRT